MTQMWYAPTGLQRPGGAACRRVSRTEKVRRRAVLGCMGSPSHLLGPRIGRRPMRVVRICVNLCDLRLFFTAGAFAEPRRREILSPSCNHTM